jgi:hypothetical protein
MKIPAFIVDYLENSSKQVPIELTLIENYLCDECYKVLSDSNLQLPKKCLIVVQDFDLSIKDDQITVHILKAFIKSLQVADYSRFLCQAEHSPQVVQSLKKHKHSELVKKLSFPDTFPEVAATTPDPLLIGFGLKSKDKSSEFSKQRKVSKVLESQDDILSAFLHESKPSVFSEPLQSKQAKIKESEEIEEEFYDFPEWSLIYLSYCMKI